jgi:hypothetical protein
VDVTAPRFFTSAGEWSGSCPDSFNPLYLLGRPQSQSGHCEWKKISCPYRESNPGCRARSLLIPDYAWLNDTVINESTKRRRENENCEGKPNHLAKTCPTSIMTPHDLESNLGRSSRMWATNRLTYDTVLPLSFGSPLPVAHPALKTPFKSHPCNRPCRPTGLWDVEAPTFSLDTRLTDGGEVIRLRAGHPLSWEDCWYSFLLEAETTLKP